MIVQGTVDRDGRLIAADPRLLALHRRAGGEDDGPLAIPQLATLARLARTLGVLVSRGVVAAEGENDLDLWVRAQAEGDNVRLSVGGWTVRERAAPDPALTAERLLDFARLEKDGRWACDPALRLTVADEVIVKLSAQSAVALTGQPVARVFRLIEDEGGDLPLLEGVARRAAFAGQVAELRAAPDVRLTLYGEPRLDAAGQFAGFAGGFTLEDRQGLQKLAVAPVDAGDGVEDMAKRLDAALREPLKRIIANADEISMRVDGPLRQDYAAYAGDISAAGRHLLGMVDDLADIRSVERADFPVDKDAVDLADVARRAAGLLRVRAADKSVRIDAPAEDETLMVSGDFRRILQILVNLLANAVRYSPSGTSVWVRMEQEGDLAAIIVADQGKGIAPEDQERIFEKFERVDTKEPGGNGLGLYISRRLARAMGGDISVDSAPGMGARFTLTLPISTP
jgi:signal transduction histidine kinase